MNIAVLDDYQRVAASSAAWDTLTDARVEFLHAPLQSDAEHAATLQPLDVIVAMRERTPFSAALLQALPKLRLLVTTGMRNASIDMAACRARGITVCGAPGSKESTGSTTELAWALILGLLKRIPLEQQALLEGRWQTGVTQSLAGKTLGLVGVGNLGSRMARVGNAFDMRVVAWSPNLTAERAQQAGVVAVDKQTLFATSDVVSLHLVLSPPTAGIVQRADLRAMKPTAILINTARAGLVEPSALLTALREQWIAGAGLDVFDSEPLAFDDPLRTLPNVLLSPHLGYVTDDNLRAFYGNAVDAIKAWQAGSPIRVLSAFSP
ncbi:MAG TPA: D-2-hydroxyacid dehydrogenase family protein [Burkholderiaceae bacterium]|nr:D-2-hydroxyacid dehydrogenase family protein [Burkholderiaceae bacterium]